MGFFEFAAGNWSEVLAATVAHVVLVLVSLGLAAAIALPLAILTYRTELPRVAVLVTAGVFLTIPSYALFGLLIAPLGLGNAPAVVALTMYGLLPIVRNAVVGLRSVDPAVAESALGMGMTSWRRLAVIDLPLAWPVIVTGLRVATQLLLGIAAIAAAVNGPGSAPSSSTGWPRPAHRSAPIWRSRDSRDHRARRPLRRRVRGVEPTHHLERHP